MERLWKDLDSLLARLSNEREVRDRLESLVSVYPFNEYEYIIANPARDGRARPGRVSGAP